MARGVCDVDNGNDLICAILHSYVYILTEKIAALISSCLSACLSLTRLASLEDVRIVCNRLETPHSARNDDALARFLY